MKATWKNTICKDVLPSLKKKNETESIWMVTFGSSWECDVSLCWDPWLDETLLPEADLQDIHSK
jgi:hypothetical protein